MLDARIAFLIKIFPDFTNNSFYAIQEGSNRANIFMLSAFYLSKYKFYSNIFPLFQCITQINNICHELIINQNSEEIIALNPVARYILVHINIASRSRKVF